MDPMTQSQLKEWFVIICTFGLFGFAAYISGDALRRGMKGRMQQHMLEKFSTAQDFANFVQSPAGQKYMTSFTDSTTSPMGSILNSVKIGFVLLFAGAGFLVGNAGMESVSFRIGWVSLLAGAGFLCAALISYFLARKIGWREKE
ncbi:MAG TPA: hypothetical protein VIX19_14765 [Terriglobales bacterium]